MSELTQAQRAILREVAKRGTKFFGRLPCAEFAFRKRVRR